MIVSILMGVIFVHSNSFSHTLFLLSFFQHSSLSVFILVLCGEAILFSISTTYDYYTLVGADREMMAARNLSDKCINNTATKNYKLLVQLEILDPKVQPRDFSLTLNEGDLKFGKEALEQYSWGKH